MLENSLALLAALLLDRILGDPLWLPHPVVGFGRLIRILEKKLRQPQTEPRPQLLGGVCLLLCLCAAALLPTLLLVQLTRGSLRFAVSVVIFWLCLSMETMKCEALSVLDQVEHGTLAQARRQVGRIVGRDPESLDRPGIIRACIESVAESTSDGIIAPMFYGAIFGPAGAMVYKAVNTLDSMVGYRNDRYLYFGRASARADDVLNFLPSRITGLLGALLAPVAGGTIASALGVYFRDHSKHASPNSGHPEAAFAGALGIELAGPAAYEGKTEPKPYINRGGRPAQAADIRRSVRLMQALVLAFAAILVLAAWMGGLPWIH